jgi:YidC/Oxa1 family membrane protein insertase
MKSDKDNIHPDDMRNLLFFFIAAMLVYFLYNHMIVRPQQQALREAQREHLLVEAQKPQAPTKMLDRPAALAESPRVELDNGTIYGSIALKGGRIDDIAFHEFYKALDKKENFILLSPKNSDFPRYVEHGWVPDGETKIAVPDSDTLWRAEGNAKLTVGNPITLVWDNGQGVRFERTYTIDKDYLITVNQKVVNNSGREISLHAYGLVTQTGHPPFYEGTWISYEGPIGFIGDKLMEAPYQKLWKEPEEKFSATQGWAGITDKYWLTALMPVQGVETNYRVSRTGEVPGKRKKGEPLPKDWGKYQVDYTGPAIAIPAGGSAENLTHVFAGAKRVLKLHEYGSELGVPNFDMAVDFGWFWFMTKPFFYILHYCGMYVGNMGIAIIILTIMIRSAVFPLTNISYRSFAKMKKVSPQVLELRQSYGEDKKKLQEELVKLYEREGVNPLAGCFPILIQIPIFFSLYKVLFVTIEMRHAPFFGWIKDLSAADPTTVFNLFGLIPWDPPSFLHVGVWPMLLLALMYVQKQLNPPPQDPIQRDMAMYMPIVLVYIMAKFAAGLVVYWTFSALIGVIQQIIIMRSLDVPIHLFGESDVEKKLDKAVAAGPAVHPLMEMAEKDAEQALNAVTEEGPKPTISPPKGRRKKKK